MSVQAITWVLEEAPDVKPHLVSTLIGLANHADRNGRGAYPLQATLAAYTRKSDRQIRKDLGEMLTAGLIREGDQRVVAHIAADRRPMVYDLAIERKQSEAADDRNHSSSRGRNHSSTRKTPTAGTTVPGGTTVPAGTTGSPRVELQGQNDRNHSSYITKSFNQLQNQKISLTGAHDQHPAETAAPPQYSHDGLEELPDDFAITDAMRRWAHRDGYATTVDIDHETAQFISYWRSEGRRKKSWPDAWQKWIRDAHTRASKPRPGAAIARITPQDQRNAMFERAMERAQAREAAGQ